MHLNIKSKEQHTYDAIVIGSGISGGWAAKELAEKGLKTLVLERGRNVEHVKDYNTAFLHPWQFKNRLLNSEKDKEDDPIQSLSYDEGSKHFFVRDKDHPYLQDKPFHWIRGYQVGGRSLTWGRACYRWSDLDFEANAKEGIAVDWPIRYKDIAPWYSYVEKFIGLSGQNENLPHLPDGEFIPAIPMNCLEEHLSQSVSKYFPERLVTPARVANLTQAVNGRGPCQYRNLCNRGCPFGAYFSSNSSTLPAAMATGNLTVRPFSIASEVLFDKETARATGVRVIDTNTREIIEFYSKIIFINASTIPTTALLLNSVSDTFPDGLGNSSGQIGHHLMDHFLTTGAEGIHEGFKDQYYSGRSPGSIYIPRFRNISAETMHEEFKRGYAFQGGAFRENWLDKMNHMTGFTPQLKEQLTTPGDWRIWIGGWGETLPYFDNTVTLAKEQKDQWGLPLVRISMEYHENEANMKKDIKATAYEMLDKAGFKNIHAFSYDTPGGAAVHEMGTARMGHDPKTSVLNGFNQMHDVKNVFITDGSCMTSSATQNPSLTYMALTARACDYAVSELNKRNL
ncbi:MAG: GMC family oxidoreductase [Azospira oryzae]|nr:MAG: GMC family oxidoreductase [Azospira oryzae]